MPLSTADVMWPRRLLLLHDPQIVVHREGERLDHLVEHLPVLPGEAHEHVEAPAAPEFQHHGSHLDGLRPGAEGDEHRGTGHADRRSLGGRSPGPTLAEGYWKRKPRLIRIEFRRSWASGGISLKDGVLSRILDDRGRIFGKVNIVDLVVLVVIVAIVVFAAVRLTGGGAVDTVPVKVTFVDSSGG